MKKHIYVRGALLLSSLLSPTAFATTATTLSSFEGSEEPTVRYLVPSDSFATGDSYVNITDRGSGVFRFELRFRKNQWWDGDRDTTLEDRGRAEVKGLGAHQKVGDTVEYSTTWRTSTNWVASGQFCHFFQLKTTDTNSVMSNMKADTNGVARFQNHSQSNDTTPRSWNYSVNTFQTVKLRIKISTTSGIAQASVNGDAFVGESGGPNYWVGAADYRPKWGLYRKQTNDMNLGDNYIEHSNVQANFGTTVPAVSNPTFNPDGGTFSSAQSVTITTATSGASIRYTTDGSTPSSTAGTLYSGPVAIATTTTLKAIAFKSGSPDSGVTSATYTITSSSGTFTYEAESLTRTTSGTSATTDSDANASGGARVTLNATGTGSWVKFTTPSIPAGTYTVVMAYKTNNNRGILNLKVDGVQVGGTLDQYASTASYPSTTFGTVTFATAGTHTIQLTVTGKNSSSSSYTLSADKFTLTSQ